MTEDARETIDDRVVRDAEMVIATEKLFHEKIVKELHVNGCEADGRINAVCDHASSFQLGKLRGKELTQFRRQTLKHPAKVPVLEFQHVYVHQEPEIVMLADDAPDGATEALQGLRLKRFFDVREHLLKARIYHLLIFSDDGFEYGLFGAIVIIKIPERGLGA